MQKINGLKSIILQIGQNSIRNLLNEQHQAQSRSKFKLYLHETDVMSVSSYVIDDTIRDSFVQYLNGGVSSWIGLSTEYVENKLWNFAKETPWVKDAVNTNIDSILSSLPETTVRQ